MTTACSERRRGYAKPPIHELSRKVEEMTTKHTHPPSGPLTSHPKLKQWQSIPVYDGRLLGIGILTRGTIEVTPISSEGLDFEKEKKNTLCGNVMTVY